MALIWRSHSDIHSGSTSALREAAAAEMSKAAAENIGRQIPSTRNRLSDQQIEAGDGSHAHRRRIFSLAKGAGPSHPDQRIARWCVIRHERVKYACPCCDGALRLAPKPEQVIPKGLFSEGLLAWVITSKYVDGLPLYRQAALLGRFGGRDLSRNTMAASVVRVGQAAHSTDGGQ